MLLLLACMTGIFLGLRFNVLVLVPISLIGTAVFCFLNLASGFSFYANFWDLLLPLIAGQAGYMLGLTGRDAYGYLLARFQAFQSNRI
jgi:hypothetical protein